MKWLDFGDADDGFTLYWRSPRYTTQGLLVQRPDRATERVDLRWAQYPSLGPGQSWDSDDVVLLLHTGDWYAGAEAFRQFVKDRYVYDAPRHIREALAIRSLWRRCATPRHASATGTCPSTWPRWPTRRSEWARSCSGTGG